MLFGLTSATPYNRPFDPCDRVPFAGYSGCGNWRMRVMCPEVLTLHIDGGPLREKALGVNPMSPALSSGVV